MKLKATAPHQPYEDPSFDERNQNQYNRHFKANIQQPNFPGCAIQSQFNVDVDCSREALLTEQNNQ